MSTLIFSYSSVCARIVSALSSPKIFSCSSCKWEQHQEWPMSPSWSNNSPVLMFHKLTKLICASETFHFLFSLLKSHFLIKSYQLSHFIINILPKCYFLKEASLAILFFFQIVFLLWLYSNIFFAIIHKALLCEKLTYFCLIIQVLSVFFHYNIGSKRHKSS